MIKLEIVSANRVTTAQIANTTILALPLIVDLMEHVATDGVFAPTVGVDLIVKSTINAVTLTVVNMERAILITVSACVTTAGPVLIVTS